MSTKKQKPNALKAQLEAALTTGENLSKRLAEEMMARSQDQGRAMTAELELHRTKQTLQVIDFILAAKPLEAIRALREPLDLKLNINLVYANKEGWKSVNSGALPTVSTISSDKAATPAK